MWESLSPQMTNTDHVSLERATQLLQQILAASAPELGARLKQRLNASLVEQGFPPFDERILGYKTFRVFLEKTQGNWVEVSPPVDGPGDIVISLRDQLRQPASLPMRSDTLPQFRNEVWQAFTNPDASRLRYLHKETGNVLHFKGEERSEKEDNYAIASDEYVKIEFIEAQQQRDWMEEFLNAVPIVGDERKAYESMMSGPYSSAMNAAFTRSLGNKRDQWREFRTSRVSTVIANWAEKHSLPLVLLERAPVSQHVERAPDYVRVGAPGSRSSHAPYQEAIKLLDLLTDQEIRSVVIPVLLSTMLLRSRR